MYSLYQWRLIAEGQPLHSVAQILLKALLGYSEGMRWIGDYDLDCQNTENCLQAWAELCRLKKKRGQPTIVPVIEGDLSIKDWRAVLSKCTSTSAAEILVQTLWQEGCDFSYGVTTVRRALVAWEEIKLSEHGLGSGGIAPEPPKAA